MEALAHANVLLRVVDDFCVNEAVHLIASYAKVAARLNIKLFF